MSTQDKCYVIFYPRALQWCTTEDIPYDDAVNTDICKSYPNVLLNNTHPILIYTIHDVFEKFHCINNDLRLCGEFYVDETILNNHGMPLKLKAGFFSSNLISYLVDTLNMDVSKIKYKIVTKKSIKTGHVQEFYRICVQ